MLGKMTKKEVLKELKKIANLVLVDNNYKALVRIEKLEKILGKGCEK